MSDVEGRSSVERIRDATAVEHERTERAVEARFFAGVVDREDFRELLEAYLGVYRPLEERLCPAAGRHLDGFEYRRRTGRLERDLRTLGLAGDRIDRVPTLAPSHLPALDGPSRVLGCLYVVEGSELGGRVIWKRLRRCLDGGALEADAFLGADADRTRERWRRFRETFDRRVAPGAPLQDAVSAARSTFRAYRRWMS